MQTTYRLAKYVGVQHYAEVTIDWEPAKGQSPAPEVAGSAFDWLRDAYGPDAKEGPAHTQYRQAAIWGAAYALQHFRRMTPGRVRILTIRVHPAHSISDDVAAATAHAVWQAAGGEHSGEPWIDQEGVHFERDDDVSG
jgi:hypothetical protein